MGRTLCLLVLIIASSGLEACQSSCAEITGVADFLGPEDHDATVNIWTCDGFHVVNDQPLVAGEPFTIEISRAGCYSGSIDWYDSSTYCYNDLVMDDTDFECGESINVEWRMGGSSCAD